jgi:hypothetical protein
MVSTMRIEMPDGKICVRRIDYIDSILYEPKHRLCQIWYNYEPESATKNYRSSLRTLDERSFERLVRAWEEGASVTLTEAPRPAGIGISQEMRHEIFKGSV